MKITCFLTGAVLAIAHMTGVAKATDYSWDVVPDNATMDDGSGTWDTNAINWSSDGGVSNAAWSDSTNDVAIFNGSAGGTIIASGSLSARGLSFSGAGTNGYVISGTGSPTLTLGAAGLVINSAAGALALDSSLSLSLRSSQAWSNESAYLLSVDSAIASTGTATLTVGGAGPTSLRGALGNGAGSFSLTKIGTGTLNLFGTGSNALNTLNLTGGTLHVGDGVTVSTADFGAGVGTVQAGTPLTITNQVILNVRGKRIAVRGSGQAFTLGGEDVLNPAAGNHRTFTVSGGPLAIGSATYPTSELMGRWTFDEGTANDSSGNGYHGTAMNGPTYDAVDVGVPGGMALVQNGLSYVKVDTGAFDGGSQSVFDGRKAITVSAWVKGWPLRNCSFVSKCGDGGQGWRIGRRDNWGNMSWLTCGTTNADGTANENLYQNTSFDQVWKLMTVTYDGQTKKFYYNGVFDGEVAVSGTINPTTAWLILGGRSDASHNIGTRNYSPYPGKLDDIYFYNRAISADEVLQIFNYFTDLDWSTTDLAAGGACHVSLPAGTTKLGRLLLRDDGTQLTIGNDGATAVSFEDISTSATASIAGALSLSLRSGNINVPGGKTLTIAPPVIDAAPAAALNKLGSGTLVLEGANAYTADTWILSGRLSMSQACLADAADVYLTSGTALNLNFTGSDTIRSLYLDGRLQKSGTWAAVGASAPHNYESALLRGSGTLRVLQGPAIIFTIR